MAIDSSESRRRTGIKYFLISLRRSVRHHARQAGAGGGDRRRWPKAGAGFAGFATWLDMTPAASRHARHARSRQPSSSCPGSRRSPGSPADCIMDGKPVDAGAAQRAEARDRRGRRATATTLKTGVECEFFLIAPDGSDHLRRRRSPGQALLRPAGADAPLRRHRRDLRLHARRSAGARIRTTTRTPTASSR